MAVAAPGTACAAGPGSGSVDLSGLRSKATIPFGAIGVVNQHYIDVPVIAPSGQLDVAVGSFLSTTNADYFGPNRFGGFNAGLALELQPRRLSNRRLGL